MIDKNIIGLIAILLTFVGYIPYIKDTIAGKTKPHVYTWFLWSLVTAIAFALQLSGGAGVGSLVTLAAATVCFIIFLLGLRIGKKDITRFDTALLISSLLAIVVWIFMKQPVISVILISFIDMTSFVPTIRKSWHRPDTETLSSYLVNTFRFALALLALQQYSIVTYLYPLTWVFANGLFSVYLIIRRKQLRKTILAS